MSQREQNGFRNHGLLDLPLAQWTPYLAPLNLGILIYKVGMITPNSPGDHNDFKRSFIKSFILQQAPKDALGTVFITDGDKTQSFQRKISIIK